MQKDLGGVIAVIGRAGRFPGGPGLDRFDAGFFGINHREAEILDPQQRVFLETCWEALEDAGYDPDAVGMTGVFAGQPVSSYLLFNLLPALSGALAGMDPLQLLVGNAPDSLATRVSYKLNLKGPSFTVQGGDSTSGLAVHLARQSLLNGECDLALAGWVSIDARTLEGTCEVLVLKRADEAVRDRDNLQSLITDSEAVLSYMRPRVRVEYEEPPRLPAARSNRSWYRLPVSARSEEALERACQRLADWLEGHPELDLGDVEFTLGAGRRRFEHGRTVECRTLEEAVESLRSPGTAGASPAVFKEETAGEAPAVPGKRVSLPTYPFERRRYWIDPPGVEAESSAFHPRPALFTPYEAPRDEAEEKVASIWQEVLGVAPVGAHDDFFQLGGHSLLAPQILARVRDVFGVDFPLQHVFSFPTPAELAEAIRFLQQEAPSSIPRSPLREAGGPYPLSFSQERLWFIDRLEPGNPVYNEPRAAWIEGRLDVAALEASLREIVDRQEALRTTFHEVDGVAVQVVSPHVTLRLPVVDLGGLPAEVRSAEAGRLSRAEARRPFDLSHGPMLRTLLLRLGTEEHLALFTVHHIASDGWSLDLLVMEVSTLYGTISARQGLPSPLPALPIQYADFAEWQRQQLQGEELERHVAYWREALAGVPTVLELPTDRPRPAVPSYHGAVEIATLPGLAEAVDELGRREGASRFMTVLAAFQALLHRLTGQDDLLVGSPVANRTRPEIEGLVGFFVNLLALRARFTENLSFRGLLGQVRDACLAAYEHQDLPFEKLVETVEMQRDLSRPPLFQVLLALQSPPLAGVHLPGLTLSAREVHAGQARFDLTLAVLEEGGGLTTALEYSTDLFEAATARRWLGHLHRLLAEAVEKPDLSLDDLELLTAAERAQIAGWSGHAVPAGAGAVPEGACLHRLFEAQAARTPAARAVSYEGRHLTYRELDRWANGLAHRLRGLGAEPGAWVGICAERSLEMVVAVLAVLKTGAAYVPLDPDYPRDRLAWVLEDAGMAALVVGPGLEERMRELGGDRIPTASLEGRVEAEGPPRSLGDADDAAYMIYTSGSTGRPKGVMVTHANAVRLFTRTEEWFRFGPSDVWTLFHSYAFDFSVWEIWGALLYGGRLVVVPYWVSRSPEDFYRLLVREQVTFLNQTPSAFGQLVQAEETLGVSPELALRFVVFGGEALNLQSLGPWWARHPEDRPRLVNMYGITETTVHVTYRPLGPSDLEGAPGSWIGAAIPDLSVHVLDRRQRPVPVGVAGELCVGGAGLARGYHNRPELTAARFIPDPFGEAPGARLYRSGDLARWRIQSDGGGELEYLGRIDHQVKIRGFRIELGEIEAALTRHPEVAEARVLVRTDRLVAFVVPRDAGRVTDGDLADGLRSWLRESLPDYMVPSAFGLRAALPLTPNGKVDTARLLREEIRQEPVRRAEERPKETAPPAPVEAPGSVEAVIAQVWKDVLDVEEVGLDDNFFDLGGHSLLLQRLCSRLRQDLDPALKLADLFRYPTVREQARLLRPEAPPAPAARDVAEAPWLIVSDGSGVAEALERLLVRAGAAVTIVRPDLAEDYEDLLARHDPGRILHLWSLEPGGDPRQALDLCLAGLRRMERALEDRAGAPVLASREGGVAEAPLSFAQERLWFLERLEPGSPAYNMLGGLRLRGRLDRAALERALAETVRRHEPLRAVFAEVGGRPVQRILPPGLSRFPLMPLADLSGLASGPREAELRRWVGEEARRPFDLETGPLLRTSLLRLDEEEHALLFVLHHIVGDGWSLGVLRSEVAALYAGATLPELRTRYADYVLGQRGLLQGRLLEERLAWWRQALEGAPTVLELPVDRPRPAVRTYRGEVGKTALPPALAASLRDLAGARRATLFMVLMTAFQALLHRITGQDDLLVGSPIAGRTEADLEPLIGLFANTLVFRSRLDPADLGFAGLVDRLRDFALGAFDHQDLPFERLVEALQVERTLAHNPLFQVSFTLQNVPGRTLDLPGLSLSEIDLSSEAAKFDLGFELTEEEDGISGRLEYAAELFDRTTVRRLLGHFRNLLEAVVANPDRRVADLPLMTLAERHQLLSDWNDSATAYPREACIHELFDEVAERAPGAVAAVFGEESCTWRELKARANRLANFLLELGVRPGAPVAIYLERSLDMVVATLSALKAGGAYVPLDTSYPEERLAFMLEDAGAPVLITLEPSLGLFEESESRRIVCLDRDRHLVESRSDRTPEVFAAPESLAYLIYTSGSTGRPKGVAVPHRAVVRLVRNTNYVDLGPDDVVAHASNTSFDAATLELWGALLNGGRLVGISKDTLLSPAALAAQLRRDGITTLFLTTSLFHQVGRSEPGVFQGLRYAIAGGEAMDPATTRQILRDGGPGQLLNGYGPTESTTFAAWYRVEDVPEGATTVPIGRPLANTTLVALDRDLQPVPIGVTGELFLGGDGLAWGYLNRPDLTAERFVPDPFASGGERLYRTGDLVRRRPDGIVEYLGRADTQVKIRGFRIEPGEIEAALTDDPEVREAAVLVDGEGSEKRLVAYVAPADTTMTAAGLRERLSRSLPAYMVPAAYVLLDALPLTPNGKVDRRALARIRPDEEAGRAGYMPPRTPTEKRLAAVWSELLPRTGVGALDEFFASGGHSLLATRLTSRVREVFGVDLPLRAVFEAPVLADMAERIEALGPEAGALDVEPIPANHLDRGPLSFAQERLWFLDRLEPGSAAYNIPAALRLTGALDPEALAASLSEVIRRHAVLRTTFAEAGGEPVQVVHPAAPLDLRVEDLRAMPPDRREAEAERAVREDVETPFDLVRGPLLRAGLLRLADDDWLLLLTVHHIVSDGWSTGILVRESVALYEAFVQGRPSPLPELPIQYLDFAVWQRTWQRGALDAQLRWWREELAGAPALLELPTDRPRPAAQSHRGAGEAVALPAGLVGKLNDLARHEGATLFMVLLAGFQALLHRWSGQDDVLVGSPVANRVRAELEGLIGFFVNTLVFRGRTAPGRTFRGLLEGVRNTAIGAYARQDLPFEKLVDGLDVERSLAHSPIFQVMLALQNVPAGTIALPGVQAKVAELPVSASKFDLSLEVTESESGLEGVLTYATDLFDRSTARRLLGHLEVLLEGAVADPDTRLADLPLLTEAERAELAAWNRTGMEYPDVCLHELIESQVEKTPDAVAVVFEGETLTYRELDEWASALAAELPDTLIGISLERSLEMVVGLVAILKAGGAYVPIDPGYPAERVAYMIEDSGVSVLLDAAQIKSWDRRRLAGGIVRRRGAGGPRIPEQPAYMIYTSGSTGRPKGALNAHRGIVNRILWMQQEYGLTPDDRVLQKTPFSFDVSVWEFFWPLIVGARLVVARPGGHQDPAYLVETIRKESITTLHFVPSMLQVFVEQPGVEDCTSLRRVMASGEALPADLAKRFFDRMPQGVELHNLYGPTEAAVDVTCHACQPGEERVPIGRPVANTRIHIFDREGNPVPVGVAGELLIAGIQVGRGYLHRPDLTAERFIPDQDGMRMYRTGDLARWLSNGEIEYLGRIDHQVKIRGFRIELGEIEAALARHPEVREAVVLVRDQSLVAYVTPPIEEDVRVFLRESLPEHMVPSAIVSLDAMPLTPNGKVDRKALAGIEPVRRTAGVYRAPRTITEERLAGIWRDLLGVERIGVEDNFFSLGGHSLMATRMVSRIRDAFGAELPLRTLFEAPTLESLAGRVETSGRAAESRIVEVEMERPPLSFGQERLWFLDRLEPGSTAYNMPLALRLRGRLDVDALERSLREMVRRHGVLRTTFAESGGVPFQVVAPEPAFELELSDEAAPEPFDLTRGPLFRAVLTKIAQDDWRLFLDMHHIVSDGWSLGVLVRESAVLYQAFSQGRPSPLPELPVQYTDFAVWQRQKLRGEALEAQVRHWREALAGAPALLELPTDRPRPAVQSYRGGGEPASVSMAIVRELAHREGATPFMVVLAAFEELLRRWSGQEDVLVGTPIANRTRAEVEGLIGLFVNTLVMRRPAGAKTFRELLSGVRAGALEAYAHQDLPFEKLVEELGVERSLAHSPLFQAMLVLQNAPVSALSLPGLALIPIDLPVDTVKFDLLLSLSEDGEGRLDYATDLFDRTTVRRLLGSFRVLLDAAVADPEARLSDLPLLTEPEKAELAAWNRTAVEYPDVCLHELIEAQVERTPDAVAVVFEGEALTYRELDEWASALAAELPSTLIGVSLERSLEMVVWLVAILKAGGAYVPIDPGYPAERVSYMIEDSGVSVLLTREEIVRSGEGEESRHRPDPDSLAYMIYTSGSTGRPKGAMNSHRGIVNRILWMQQEYGLTPDDRVLQKTPFSFDVSVWEFFWPLIVGARLVVARPGGHQDPAYLVETIQREEITTLHFVPSMLQVFVEQPGADRCTSLRRVMASGEALPADLAKRFFARMPQGVELHNLYGPTEAAVDVTYHACRPGEERIPIGRPVANTRIHILDADGNPVPVGVAGELHIAGVQVGRGYLHRPDLTAERFVPDQNGARMYRTGDLARWLANGEIEYLGRIDHQVKIRGFRIELGEIEAVLARQPGVREAVVLARDGRLAAYVVGNADRAALARELPEYMVPSAWVVLDAMPLSPNGKVDRRALARIEAGIQSETEWVAPRTPAEALVSGIWSDLLGVDQPGAHDNFFTLGGHSLLATRLISRIREAFGMELPLRTVFEAPVLTDLAVRIETLSREAGSLEERPILPTHAARGPLSFAQERLWFLDRLQPGSAAYNIPAALRLTGLLDPEALAASLSEIVRRHATLRTTFEEQDGEPAQVIHPAQPLELPVEDLRALPADRREAEAARAVREDVEAPFDLVRGPLLRARLLRLDEHEWLLLLTVHHIVTDGWSTGVLVRESAMLYEAFAQGRLSPLPELPIQYLDFAVWQRMWLRGEALEAQLLWWREELAGAPALLELPTDRPRPAVQSYRGAGEALELPAGLVQALQRLARKEGATLFMALLSGFQALLHRWSGQDDVLVGSPVANRTRSELEGLIGLFVNTLVFRGRTSSDRTFRGLLTGVRDAAVAGYSHQDLPFEKLVEGLGVQRSLAHSPLFQVMLALQNVPTGSIGLTGVQASMADLPITAAKFDLTLELTEVESGIQGVLTYATDLFDPETARRLLGHYQVLLEGAAANPDARLADLPLLTEAEKAELAAWNRTEVEYPDVCLHELIESQVEKTPDAVAVVFEEETLTYRELDEWASALAAELPATLIGISVERSL
ncbi:MAG TPA: non-ribosomal peptide synthase/polyketide synthase, partial [Thermoanaerobaculia bacterium]|nr:non-ribosomal peptide synthase/polyketide synthase [Thermoanaerobaculia bacterium]